MTLAYLEQAKAKGLIPVLEDKTKIQFLYLNQDIVQVDLNDSFITQQNDSPELENARIQSLVNTLCQYYQAKGVQLTINDQRYESNQRKIEPTEVLTPVY
ncbi:Sporulation and spore germination [anaerobic digester metagenome]